MPDDGSQWKVVRKYWKSNTELQKEDVAGHSGFTTKFSFIFQNHSSHAVVNIPLTSYLNKLTKSHHAVLFSFFLSTFIGEIRQETAQAASKPPEFLMHWMPDIKWNGACAQVKNV